MTAREQWDALVRTAVAVEARAASTAAPVPRCRPRRDPRTGGAGRPLRAGGRRLGAAAAIAVAAVASAARIGAGSALPAHADGGADADLFALTNQDRASNGVAALTGNPTLQSIGEAYAYRGCGFPVTGRSYDMIERSYFAHPILNCGGQNVFNIMQAAGVGYRAAGENIGWTGGLAGDTDAANYVNQSFMNSSEHRANILDGAYTHLGIGSDFATSWGYSGGGPYNSVWMWSEEFAQLAAPAPPSTPRPTPAPTPVRNEPAPPPPPPGSAASTAPPSPASAPSPAATPAPAPAATPAPAGPVAAPMVWSDSGLLPGSIESVLEAYLD